jgi:hypothetical protein
MKTILFSTLWTGFVSSCPKKCLNKHAFMHLKLAKYALKYALKS